MSFQNPFVYHFRNIKFHSVEETVILVVFKPWQQFSHHLRTNDGEKTIFDKARVRLLAEQAERNNKQSKIDFGYD